MAASKLAIYNQALGHLGERRLASLSEQREPRRVLDDYYTDVVAHCLEMGAWKFAVRSARIDASAGVTPEFGFTRAFRKPDDWVRTGRISESEFFDPPLLRFREERGYWHADCDPVLSDGKGGKNNLISWSTASGLTERFITWWKCVPANKSSPPSRCTRERDNFGVGPPGGLMMHSIPSPHRP